MDLRTATSTESTDGKTTDMPLSPIHIAIAIDPSREGPDGSASGVRMACHVGIDRRWPEHAAREDRRRSSGRGLRHRTIPLWQRRGVGSWLDEPRRRRPGIGKGSSGNRADGRASAPDFAGPGSAISGGGGRAGCSLGEGLGARLERRPRPAVGYLLATRAGRPEGGPRRRPCPDAPPSKPRVSRAQSRPSHAPRLDVGVRRREDGVRPLAPHSANALRWNDDDGRWRCSHRGIASPPDEDADGNRRPRIAP